ncbi:NB-ARC domain protein [Nocardiopsis sp. HNM0947]|uniref:NB-ARC domain protein n=1 Tax=Nocardiopsis coralli TaxID=2772213 RepID=A0ABR9PEA1_9ACTN|nr:NB-ARC domain-containing protein [Nocardiopsis coralli]MBE3002175.1 NB-ARC domain protein [Nocardiopsis coralli]
MSNPPHHNESSGDPETLLQFRDANGVVNVNQYIRPPEPPSPPRQAPAADSRFTDRTAELTEIERIAREAAVAGRGAVVVLVGDEGVGKSATLAEIAHRLHGPFPDGVLHRDLAQWRDGRGILDHEAVQRSLLRDLHAQDVTGTATADRLRTATAGSGVLLLLDGVASSAELEAVSLGSGPHLVVATGPPELVRDEELVGRVRRLFDLRELPPNDSMELLRSFPGVDRRLSDPDEHASARRLVEICGHLPAAVRMAGGHVEAQGLSVTALVRALESRLATVPPPTGVDAVIELALSGLGETEYRVLELLSAYPGRRVPGELGPAELGEPAARARAELEGSGLLHPGEAAETGVVELVRARVRADAGPRARLDTDALVRFFTVTHHLADRASLGERLRLVDHLDADDLTLPPTGHRAPFTTRREAGDWQDRHLAAVPELLRLAGEREDPAAVSAAYVLAEAVWPVCYGRGRTAVGTQVYGYALQVARTYGHHRARLRMACYLARLWAEAGAGDRAAAALAGAEEAGGAAESTEGLDGAVLCETRALLLQRFPDAVGGGQGTTEELLLRARDIHRAHGRPRGDALQTYQLGNDARERGDLDGAEQELSRARRITDRRIDELERAGRDAPRGALEDWNLIRAKVRLAQARVHLERGEPDPADHEAGQAQKVFCEYLETVRWVRAVRLLAEASELRGAPDEARDRLREAGRISRYFRLEEQGREILHHWERLDPGNGSGER